MWGGWVDTIALFTAVFGAVMAVMLLALAGPAGAGGRRRRWPVRWRLPVACDDGQDRPAPARSARCAGGGVGSRRSSRCRRRPARRAGAACGVAGLGHPTG